MDEDLQAVRSVRTGPGCRAAVLHSSCGDVLPYLPTIRALRAIDQLMPILIVGAATGSPVPQELLGLGVTCSDGSLREALASAFVDGDVALFLTPALLPQHCFDCANDALADPRVATVSFWSNVGDHTAFPERWTLTRHEFGGMTEDGITQALRSARPVRPLVLPVASGPVVVISRDAYTVSEGWPPDEGFGSLGALYEFSAKLVRRGFVPLLDPSTFVAAPLDLDTGYLEQVRGGGALASLQTLDPGAHAIAISGIPALALPRAFALARSTVGGLRVAIDGRCFGDHEMGTQVHVRSLIGALAEHAAVAEVVVLTHGPLPPYARDVLDSPNVTAWRISDPELPRVDVVHRPFQPDGNESFEHARALGARTLLTLQDLITYRISSYFATADEWLAYRSVLEHALRTYDGIVCFTDDVVEQSRLDSLPIDEARTFVVPIGTDHLGSADEPTSVPRALPPSWAGAEFALVLGANYAHKNRDLAIAAVEIVRATTGRDLRLLLVGTSVPFGTSRLAEARRWPSNGDEWALAFEGVTAAERNWLLQRASVVLYPTAAEGFGLVPFEAAAFGTPTLNVLFGPLGELMPDAPVTAGSWAPADLAAALERLLADPALVRGQIAAARVASQRYTWAETADQLVDAYRTTMALPYR